MFNTLLQILEEGRLTDSQGRSVDFRNTVLIMTSNLGTADLRKANVGFTTADSAMSYERMKEKVMDALKTHFRPEFLNRIDEVIVFHELSTAPRSSQMVDLMTQAAHRPARGSGPRHRAHPVAPRSSWPSKGYDPQLGARPLRRAIQRLVEDPLSRSCCTRSSAPARSSSSTPRTTPTSRASCGITFSRGRGLRAAGSPSSWPPRRASPTAVRSCRSSTRRPAHRRPTATDPPGPATRRRLTSAGVIRRVLAVLALVVVLASCRLDAAVDVSVDADGSGTVALTVTVDADVVAQVPGLAGALNLDDAQRRRAGPR